MDLYKLILDDAYAILEELPSDVGSISSYAPSVDELEEMDDDDFIETVNNHLDDPTDIHAFEKDCAATVSSARIYEPDSEDELSLINFIRNPIEWTDDPNFANKPRSFAQDFGTNIPSDVESPTDTFSLHVHPGPYRPNGISNKFICRPAIW